MSKLQRIIESLQEEKEKLSTQLDAAKTEVTRTEELLSARKTNEANLSRQLQSVEEELEDAIEFVKSQEAKSKKKPAEKKVITSGEVDSTKVAEEVGVK